MTAKKEVTKEKKVGAVKPAKKEVEELVVTQEYFDAHPELEADGVAVGDTIEVPVAPKETDSKLNLDKEVSILKGMEYIRTYPAGMKEAVAGFLSKDEGKYVAVDPKKIVSVTVSWRESIKRKDEDTGRMVDTGRMETKTSVFTEKTHGVDFKKKARSLANESVKRSCVASLG
jgi:hypothetical protein